VALHTFCGPSSKNDGTSNSHDFAKFTSWVTLFCDATLNSEEYSVQNVSKPH
jgi:hypothetical protein